MPLLLKSVPATHGVRWVRDALGLYARRPLAFAMMFAVFLVAAMLVSWLPWVGRLLQMSLLPMLSLGFMLASQSALLGGPVQPLQFVEPLQGNPARRRALLTLCVLYGLSAVGILLLCDLISGGALERLTLLTSQSEPNPTEVNALMAEPGVATAGLAFGVLVTLLSVPFWHAPALVHWGAHSVGQALFSSTLAVWRSKGAFLVFGLTWLALSMVFGVVTALLFAMLDLHQLAPVLALPAALMFSTVFYVSLLFTFNDSFGSAAATGLVPGEPDES